MAIAKLKEFSAVQRAAPERIELHEQESALRSAQYALDVQLMDLKNEFLAREGKLRQEFLDRVNQITSGE